MANAIRTARHAAACGLAATFATTWPSARSSPPETSADVVVVGGGIAGAAVARELTARGLSVTLLERGTVGCEASGLSAGTFWCGGWGLSARDTTVHEALCAGTAEIYAELDDTAEGGIDLVRCGSLELVLDAFLVPAARAAAAAARARGVDVSYVEGRDALAALEPALAGGTAVGALHR